MKSNNIKKFLSAALLIAFTSPAGICYPTYGGYNSYSNNSSSYASDSSTSLSSSVNLSEKNEKITLSLRDSDVKQVLRMFADKAGRNIVFHSGVTGNITLDMVDMPINDAFDLVLQITSLNFYIKDNTVVVVPNTSTDNAAFSRQEMMVFPVQYVSAAKVADFLNKNVFGIKSAGGKSASNTDAATVNAATNEVIIFGRQSDAAIVKKVIAQLDKEPISRTFVVNHTTPAEMSDMVCNMLLPAHGMGEGGKSGGKSDGYVPPVPGVGTSFVTGGAASTEGGSSSSGGGGTMSQVKIGEGIVACTVSQSPSGSLTGFDMQNISISYYPQRGTIMMMGGSEAQMRLVENFIKTNDIKQPQAYLEMSIVELNEEGSKEFQNNWSLQSNAWGVSFNNGVTSGGREGGYGRRSMPVTRWGWTTETDQETGATKDKYWEETGRDYINKKGTYISWTMNYLIENKKGRVLANPKIIITNGQESVIDLTEDYVEKVTSEFLSTTGSFTSGAVQKTYTIGDDKGIKVSLMPFISSDGYVTLNIKPQYATEAGNVYSYNEAGGRDIAATLLNRRNLDLKNVRIKDGETLIIGGMIQEVEAKNVQKIPVLGDLPLVGGAFRSTTTTKNKSELVIMITPRIINDGETVADRL